MSRRISVGIGAIAVVALAMATSVVAATVPPPADPIPGSEAQAALNVLTAPSSPHPLPGSRAVSLSGYRYTAGCEALRVAYQTPGAPVPTGAVVSVVADGGLRFDASFGPSAVFVRDDPDGACTYEIRSAPTFVIDGSDVPALNGFFTVSCIDFFSITTLIVVEVVREGQPPLTIGLGTEETLGGSAEPPPWNLIVYPGPAMDALAEIEVPGMLEFEGLSGVYDGETGAGTVTGTGPTGPINLSFQCTVTNFTIPGL